MNAVVFHEHGGPGKLQYQEMPMPTIGVDEVLVRVKACALNHLDIWIRQGSPAYPMPLPHILGSDISGVVHQIGSHVEGVAEGERVYVAPGVGCGRCEHCWAGRDNMCRSYGLIGAMCHGGYAEYVKVPARNVFPIPGALSFEQAAAFPSGVCHCLAYVVRVGRCAARRRRLDHGGWQRGGAHGNPDGQACRRPCADHRRER
jgi:NADPH:quinone reductase-like Zn-dependent oxidoreductase